MIKTELTDNELTAAIGRELMGWTIDETPSATWKFWLLIPGSTTRTKKSWAERPTEEDIGEVLAREGYAYASDPKWSMPILLAARESGILAYLLSNDDVENPRWLMRAFCTKTRIEADSVSCDDDSNLPRSFCIAILKARGVIA